MNTKPLSEILAQKVLNNQLGSFYIIHYKNEDDCQNFIDHFKKTQSSLMDHPDFLTIECDKGESSYKVDSQSIKSFIHFLNYHPIKLKKRFVFFKEAHLLSDIVSNKLLKTFEELSQEYCLFLFCPHGEELLSTVLSRGIKVALKGPKIANSEQHKMSLNELLNGIKEKVKDDQDPSSLEQDYLNDILNATLSQESYEVSSEELNKLKLFEQSSRFNNAQSSRLAFLGR